MTDLEELGRCGAAFYDAHLRAILEPAHDKEFVAIHPDTGDYAVARWSGDAMRALRARHPEGSMWIRKIGSEPEYGLAARLLAAEMQAGKTR